MNFKMETLIFLFIFHLKIKCRNNSTIYVENYNKCDFNNECDGSLKKPYSGLINGFASISQIISKNNNISLITISLISKDFFINEDEIEKNKHQLINNKDGTFGLFKGFYKQSLIIIPNKCNKEKCSNRTNIHLKSSLLRFEINGFLTIICINFLGFDINFGYNIKYMKNDYCKSEDLMKSPKINECGLYRKKINSSTNVRNSLFLFRNNKTQLFLKNCNFESINPVDFEKKGYISLISSQIKNYKYKVILSNIIFNQCFFIFGLVYFKENEINFYFEKITLSEYNKFSIISEAVIFYIHGASNSFLRVFSLRIKETINIFYLFSIVKVEINNVSAIYNSKLNNFIGKHYFFEIVKCNVNFSNFKIENLTSILGSSINFFSSKGNFTKSKFGNISFNNYPFIYFESNNIFILEEIIGENIVNSEIFISLNYSNKIFFINSIFKKFYSNITFFGKLLKARMNNEFLFDNLTILSFNTSFFIFSLKNKNIFKMKQIVIANIINQILTIENDNLLKFCNVLLKNLISYFTLGKTVKGLIKGVFRNKLNILNFTLFSREFKEKKGFFFFHTNNSFKLNNFRIIYPSHIFNIGKHLFLFFWIRSYNSLNIIELFYKNGINTPSILGEFINFNDIIINNIILLLLSSKMNYYDKGILYGVNNNNISFSNSIVEYLQNIHGNIFFLGYSFNNINLTNLKFQKIQSNKSFGILKLFDNNVVNVKIINIEKISILSAALIICNFNNNILVLKSNFSKINTFDSGGIIRLFSENKIEIKNSLFKFILVYQSGGIIHSNSNNFIKFFKCKFLNINCYFLGAFLYSNQNNVIDLYLCYTNISSALLSGGYAFLNSLNKFKIKNCLFTKSISMIGSGFTFMNFNILSFISNNFSSAKTVFFGGFVNVIDSNLLYIFNCSFKEMASEIQGLFFFSDRNSVFLNNCTANKIQSIDSVLLYVFSSNNVTTYGCNFSSFNSKGGFIIMQNKSRIILNNINIFHIISYENYFPTTFGFFYNNIIIKNSKIIDFQIHSGNLMGFKGMNVFIFVNITLSNVNCKTDRGIFYFENNNSLKIIQSKFSNFNGKLKGNFIDIILNNTIRISMSEFSNILCENGAFLSAFQNNFIVLDQVSIKNVRNEKGKGGLSKINMNNKFMLRQSKVCLVGSFKDGGIIFASSYNIMNIIDTKISNVIITHYDSKGGMFFAENENNTLEIRKSGFNNISSPAGELFWTSRRFNKINLYFSTIINNFSFHSFMIIQNYTTVEIFNSKINLKQCPKNFVFLIIKYQVIFKFLNCSLFLPSYYLRLIEISKNSSICFKNFEIPILNIINFPFQIFDNSLCFLLNFSIQKLSSIKFILIQKSNLTMNNFQFNLTQNESDFIKASNSFITINNFKILRKSKFIKNLINCANCIIQFYKSTISNLNSIYSVGIFNIVNSDLKIIKSIFQFIKVKGNGSIVNSLSTLHFPNFKKEYSIEFIDSIFAMNLAFNFGGVIFINSKLKITNLKFSRTSFFLNQANKGGILYASFIEDIKFYNCKFFQKFSLKS